MLSACRRRGSWAAGQFRSMAFLALGFWLVPDGAIALRIPAGGFTVVPAKVYLSRTLTVSVVLEDEDGMGAAAFAVGLQPEPASAVKLITEEVNSQWTCTGNERTTGRWVYEVVEAGEVSFTVHATQLSCDLDHVYHVEATTNPVRLNAFSVWRELKVDPPIAVPGDELFLTLLLRNEEPFTLLFSTPQAEMKFPGQSNSRAEPQAPYLIEPFEVMRSGVMSLYPRQTVSVTWRFQAVRPGAKRFLVTGMGMATMSLSALVRYPARPVLHMPEPIRPATIGSHYALWGTLCNEGAAALDSPVVGLSWRPQEAAHMVFADLSSTGFLEPEGGASDLLLILELLRPGTLTLTLTAGGVEADTGRAVSAEAWTHTLTVP